jgi:8-oxo-dGTP pyrophosphatase MutT (NUDIX family)
VVRDSNAGPEVLMLKRSKDLKFAGGMWVFPGGRIDTEDFTAAGFDPDTERDLAEAREGAARQAAVREAAEEADLVIELSGLRRWSHWTPPPRADNRFTTAFFVAVVDGGDVTVDDGEIREHRWMRPTDVIDARDAGEIGLAPPTYITLHQMQGLTDAAAVLDAAVPDGTEPEHFATRFTMVGNDVVAMYFGDVAYEDVELVDNDGPRHRLVMGGTWSYARDPGLTQQR